MAFQGLAFVVVGLGLASLLYYMFSGSGEQQYYNNPNSSNCGGPYGASYSSWDPQPNNEQRQRVRRRRQRSSHTEECIICFQDLKKGDTTELQCGHIYHKKCITEWTNHRPLGTQKTCPLCRMQYTNI